LSESKPRSANVLLRKLQFPTEYGLFVVVNLLDLFITMLFIRYGGGEANPAARWIMLSFGKTGFVVYKVVLMLVVIGLCEAVAQRRKAMARALIWFGIVALTAVAVSGAVRYYHYMQDPEHGGTPATIPARPTPRRMPTPVPPPMPPGPMPPGPMPPGPAPPPPDRPPEPRPPGGQ